MSARNSHTAKATRRAARQASDIARTGARDPAVVALELVRTVLYAESGTDLPEARRLLPDGTPPDLIREVLLYMSGLAAASAVSEAGHAGITPGEYVDDLIRRRLDGDHHDGS